MTMYESKNRIFEQTVLRVCSALVIVLLGTTVWCRNPSNLPQSADKSVRPVLYVLSGYPLYPRYGTLMAASSLFMVADAGLQEIRNLVPQGVGTQCILPFYPSGYYVVCRTYFHDSCEIVDMAHPISKMSLKLQSDRSYVEPRTLMIPDRGPFLALGVVRESDMGYRLPDGTEELLAWSMNRFVQVYGSSWIGDTYSRFDPWLREDGRLQFRTASPPNNPTLVDAPKNIRELKGKLWMPVKTSDWMVFYPQIPPEGGEGKRVLFIFDEHSKAWNEAAFPGDATWIRDFGGDWLAMVVAQRTTPGLPVQGHPVYTENGIPAEVFFADEGFEVPGHLILYNMRTRRTLEWKTGVSDSEVLWTDGERVVYRVADSLYVAKVEQFSLSEIALLAQSPQILNIHWAFWGPTPRHQPEDRGSTAGFH